MATKDLNDVESEATRRETVYRDIPATDAKNVDRDANPDAITGAPGSHPVSTGVGAAAAGAAGAVIGSVVPGIGTVVGGVIGAVVGSVGGGYAGKAVGEAMDPTNDDEYYRRRHATSDYVQKGTEFSTVKPAYDYGRNLGSTGTVDASFDATVGSTALRAYDEDTVRSQWEATPHAKTLPYEQAAPAIRDAYDRTLKLREEQLRVSKDRVQAGEVSLRKEITTETKTIEVPIEREEVVITRRSASSTGDAGTIGDDEEIRVPVSEERVNVTKDTIVTGEVDISKRTVTDKQTVTGEVRKENVKVDRTGNTRIDDRTND